MSAPDDDAGRALAEARDALARLAAEAHSLAEAAEQAGRALDRSTDTPDEREPARGGPSDANEPEAPAEPRAATSDRGPGTGLARGDLDDAEASLATGAGETAAPEAPAGPPAAAAPDPPEGPENGSNVDRARLGALNLALRGVPRDEAERRLGERFEVDGLDEILDEAYERAERAD